MKLKYVGWEMNTGFGDNQDKNNLGFGDTCIYDGNNVGFGEIG